MAGKDVKALKNINLNYLAHAYLSFGYPELLVGNMISDFVKGRKKDDYPAGVKQGIVLHRAIDAFTDDHPVTRHARTFLKAAVGLYSGAFVDVVYDHFLANDDSQFPETSLATFAGHTYNTLKIYEHLLPSNFRLMLPYMREQNWLYNYRMLKGIENSFAGVARRAKYLDTSRHVFFLFEENYAELQKCYNEFFPALKDFTVQQLKAWNIT